MSKVKKQKVKIEKPSIVRGTVVKFCVNNGISVREFVNNASRTRLSNLRDESKMQRHLELWSNYGWL